MTSIQTIKVECHPLDPVTYDPLHKRVLLQLGEREELLQRDVARLVTVQLPEPTKAISLCS